MTLPNYVYADAEDPDAIRVDLKSSETVQDLRVVTSVSLHVKKPDGTRVTWTTLLSLKTAGSLRATHVFAADDVSQTGLYKLVPYLTTPSGTRRGVPSQFTVRPVP